MWLFSTKPEQTLTHSNVQHSGMERRAWETELGRKYIKRFSWHHSLEQQQSSCSRKACKSSNVSFKRFFCPSKRSYFISSTLIRSFFFRLRTVKRSDDPLDEFVVVMLLRSQQSSRTWVVRQEEDDGVTAHPCSLVKHPHSKRIYSRWVFKTSCCSP